MIVFEFGGDLYAIASTGARTVRLTATKPEEFGTGGFPDGSSVAFVRDGGGISTMKLDSSANRTRAEVPSVPLSERTRRRSFDGIPQEGLTAAVRTVTPLGSCHRERALPTLP